MCLRNDIWWYMHMNTQLCTWWRSWMDIMHYEFILYAVPGTHFFRVSPVWTLEHRYSSIVLNNTIAIGVWGTFVLQYIIDAVGETCSLCWGETFQVLTFALIYLLQFRHVWSPVSDHQWVFILSELYQNQGLIDMIFLIDGSDFSAFVVSFKTSP